MSDFRKHSDGSVTPTRGRTKIVGFLAASVALVVLIWIAAEVASGRGAAFDEAVRHAVQARAFSGLTCVMLWMTQLGAWWFLVPAGLLVVWRLAATGRKHGAILLAGSALGGEGLTQILKLVFHRTRPQAFFGLTSPANYSFPSGHAITACCFWGVLAAILAARARSGWAKAGLWTSAAVLAVLVGFSRVYLGMHYPTDVLAGYAVGVMWVAVVRGAASSARPRAGESPAPPRALTFVVTLLFRGG
jgi:undecaprenyl-diphosphatase